MKARTVALILPLLTLACPRPTDHNPEDSAAGETAVSPATETGEPASAPKPAPQPAPSPDACATELDALKGAVEQVEQCVAGL